jgi:hypothetical protein
MDAEELAGALATALPERLANDLVGDFLDIRRDVATGTLGRASPGKFVETLVQCLEALESDTNAYSSSPKVDAYLRGLESRQSTLPDGLRVCAARVGRAMYSLRSKRNIVHKADIDPSGYDLRFLYAGAQWVLAELVGLAQEVSGSEAARLIAQVQLPVGELVETLGDKRLVQAELRALDEALLVLMSYHPAVVPVQHVVDSMDRRASKTVQGALNTLWKGKLIHRPQPGHVVLTDRGLREAIAVAQKHLA